MGCSVRDGSDRRMLGGSMIRLQLLYHTNAETELAREHLRLGIEVKVVTMAYSDSR